MEIDGSDGVWKTIFHFRFFFFGFSLGVCLRPGVRAFFGNSKLMRSGTYSSPPSHRVASSLRRAGPASPPPRRRMHFPSLSWPRRPTAEWNILRGCTARNLAQLANWGKGEFWQQLPGRAGIYLVARKRANLNWILDETYINKASNFQDKEGMIGYKFLWLQTLGLRKKSRIRVAKYKVIMPFSYPF